MISRMNLYSLLAVAALSSSLATAQTQSAFGENVVESKSRSWEFGLGGNLANLDRVTVAGSHTANNYNKYDLDIKHLLGGGHLYVARELMPWLYLDLQGSVGFGKSLQQTDQLFMGGLGLQVRPFKSTYVEPYLRVGVNYAHKNFSTKSEGIFQDDASGLANWQSTNTWNNSVQQQSRSNFVPISVGAGVNAWLNNHWGVGLQGEYLHPIQKDAPKFVQVSLRLMYRLGGRDKRRTKVQYVEVEKIVERIVPKVEYVEVEKPVAAPASLCELFNNINFEFDKDLLTTESEMVCDRVADILKSDSNKNSRFLITGFTDTRGSDAYNIDLSQRRARRVVEALKSRGVPSSMLKQRGVGKRTAAMGYHEADHVRLGDRKVTIEKIENAAYWEKLP